MKCTYQPVGKYLLIERIPDYTSIVEHGKVTAIGRDVSIGIPVGHVVAYRGATITVHDFNLLVHEDDIVAVVTEIR